MEQFLGRAGQRLMSRRAGACAVTNPQVCLPIAISEGMSQWDENRMGGGQGWVGLWEVGSGKLACERDVMMGECVILADVVIDECLDRDDADGDDDE